MKARGKTAQCLTCESCRREPAQKIKKHPGRGRAARSPDEASLFHEANEWLQEESQCSQYAHRHKDPEEDSVDDHCHVLPVVLHLQADTVVFLSEPKNTYSDKTTGSTAQSCRFITKSLTTAKSATFTSRHCVAAAAEWL